MSLYENFIVVLQPNQWSRSLSLVKMVAATILQTPLSCGESSFRWHHKLGWQLKLSELGMSSVCQRTCGFDSSSTLPLHHTSIPRPPVGRSSIARTIDLSLYTAHTGVSYMSRAAAGWLIVCVLSFQKHKFFDSFAFCPCRIQMFCGLEIIEYNLFLVLLGKKYKWSEWFNRILFVCHFFFFFLYF